MIKLFAKTGTKNIVKWIVGSYADGGSGFMPKSDPANEAVTRIMMEYCEGMDLAKFVSTMYEYIMFCVLQNSVASYYWIVVSLT